MLTHGTHDITLTRGGSGVFEITLDGSLAFSKKALRRFPSEAELDAMLVG
jgi:selT/selW/selH-like putative selenoprotein